jgi:hypothetical protein
VIRYSGNGVQAAAIYLKGVSYWTVQNLVFDGTGVWTSSMALWVGGPNWSTGPDQRGIQILNNTFKNWGGTAAQESSTTAWVVALNIGGGWAPPVGAYLPDGTVIRGNTFEGNRLIALSMTSTKNSLVEDNEFKNLTCGAIADGGGGTAVVTLGIHIISGTPGVGSGDLYRNNLFHDFQSPTLCGLTPSAGSYTEMTAIHCDVNPSNGTVQGNRIWNLDPTNAGQQAIAIHIEQDCHGWTVQNNIVHDIGWSGIRHNPTTSGTVNQYLGNAIYNTGVHAIEFHSGDAVVLNNIFDLGAASQIYVASNAASYGNLTIDYNDYWSANNGANVGQWNTGWAQTFSSWKASCNCDSHSLNVNPLFVNPPANLQLQASSPARAAGQNGIDMGGYPVSPASNVKVISQ